MATLRGVKHAEPLQPGSVLEKAVKDSYSSLDNCYHVVIYGAQVTESHVHDFESRSLHLMLEMQLLPSCCLHLFTVLKNGKLLKNIPQCSVVFVQPSHTPEERQHIKALY